MTTCWKKVEQYFTVVLFVFSILVSLQVLKIYQLGTLRSEHTVLVLIGVKMHRQCRYTAINEGASLMQYYGSIYFLFGIELSMEDHVSKESVCHIIKL